MVKSTGMLTRYRYNQARIHKMIKNKWISCSGDGNDDAMDGYNNPGYRCAGSRLSWTGI